MPAPGRHAASSDCAVTDRLAAELELDRRIAALRAAAWPTGLSATDSARRRWQSAVEAARRKLLPADYRVLARDSGVAEADDGKLTARLIGPTQAVLDCLQREGISVVEVGG